MYNFLVSGLEVTSPHGSLKLTLDRVFLHTDPDLEARYSSGGALDDAALMALPALITSESSNDPAFPVFARVCKITKIRRDTQRYYIDYVVETDIPPIPNAVLESLAAELHFVISRRGFDDFHTNHWAVKDADLFHALYSKAIGQSRPRIFKLPEEPTDASLVALMMPFDAGFNGVNSALQDAVTAASMRCLRADNIWDHDAIIQDVVKLIATARVVICDLTNKNANVFYEAGIAHTLGKDVILIAQHDSDVPFDLRHIRYIKYLSNEQGLKELAEKVSSRLTDLVRK